MKSYSVDSRRNKYSDKPNLLYTLKDYVLSPCIAGLFGFIAFFSILIVTKFFSYMIGTYDNLAFDWDDVFLSSIGFILVFLIRFLENFKEEGT